MFLVVLVCLIVGVGFVAVAQRDVTRAATLERVGGWLVVVSLVGLGLLLAAARWAHDAGSISSADGPIFGGVGRAAAHGSSQ